MKTFIALFAIAAFLSAFTPSIKKAGAASEENIQRTVDSINRVLAQYCSYKPTFKVNTTGEVVIMTSNHQFFSFNIIELENSIYATGVQVDGIEMVACDPRRVAANGWINFTIGKRKAAFIKFDCIDTAELARIHRLMVDLRARVIENMYA
jgi:hypothetical protein